MIHLSFLNDTVRIGYDRCTNRIEVIDIEKPEAVAELNRRGIRDDKLNLVGKSKTAILTRFGTPTSDDHDMYVFEYKGSQEASGDVTFTCRNRWDYLCKEMSVQWYFDGETIETAPGGVSGLSQPIDGCWKSSESGKVRIIATSSKGIRVYSGGDWFEYQKIDTATYSRTTDEGKRITLEFVGDNRVRQIGSGGGEYIWKRTAAPR